MKEYESNHEIKSRVVATGSDVIVLLYNCLVKCKLWGKVRRLGKRILKSMRTICNCLNSCLNVLRMLSLLWWILRPYSTRIQADEVENRDDDECECEWGYKFEREDDKTDEDDDLDNEFCVKDQGEEADDNKSESKFECFHRLTRSGKGVHKRNRYSNTSLAHCGIPYQLQEKRFSGWWTMKIIARFLPNPDWSACLEHSIVDEHQSPCYCYTWPPSHVTKHQQNMTMTDRRFAVGSGQVKLSSIIEFVVALHLLSSVQDNHSIQWAFLMSLTYFPISSQVNSSISSSLLDLSRLGSIVSRLIFRLQSFDSLCQLHLCWTKMTWHGVVQSFHFSYRSIEVIVQLKNSLNVLYLLSRSSSSNTPLRELLLFGVVRICLYCIVALHAVSASANTSRSVPKRTLYFSICYWNLSISDVSLWTRSLTWKHYQKIQATIDSNFSTCW